MALTIRGKKKLYGDLIPSSIEDVRQFQKDNTGLRDDALAARYYFHANIERYPYEDCLLMLNQAFFISPDQIIKRLNKRSEMIKKMILEKATPSDLKKSFPHYDWRTLRACK